MKGANLRGSAEAAICGLGCGAALQREEPVELMGLGDDAVWSYSAAAVAPVPIDLHTDLANFRDPDEDFLGVLNVPGIQRAGGLSAAKLVLTVQSAAK